MFTDCLGFADVSRLAQQGREFEGRLALAHCSRLRSLLAHTEGEVAYHLVLGADVMGRPQLRVRVHGNLPLTCQASLEVYPHPVAIDTTLGVVRQEADEDGLLTGQEPLLVGAEGMRLLDVVEDELILALPVIPRMPSAEPIAATQSESGGTTASPFAALAALKQSAGAS